MKRQHSCTLVLYFLYRCSTNICTRRIYILYKVDFERFAHFECSKHSSFLLWKQMGVEGEDPENTALSSVLCYSADDSADIPDGRFIALYESGAAVFMRSGCAEILLSMFRLRLSKP